MSKFKFGIADAKLEQIGADKTKGTLITPTGFDRGTVEYAQSKGIGLCRYIPRGSPVYILEDRKGVADKDILNALTIPNTTAFRFYGNFYAVTSNGLFTTDIAELAHIEFQNVSEI